MDNNVIGKRIEKVIKDSGISQKDIAIKFGLNKSTVSSYVHGRMVPSLEVLLKFCELGDVSLDWLCGREQFESISKKHYPEVAKFFISLANNEHIFNDFSFGVQTDNMGHCREVTLQLTENENTKDSEAMFDMLEELSGYVHSYDILSETQRKLLLNNIQEKYDEWKLIN